jgi:hypothetical protein
MIVDREYTYTYVLDVRYDLARAIAGQARHRGARGTCRTCSPTRSNSEAPIIPTHYSSGASSQP